MEALVFVEEHKYSNPNQKFTGTLLKGMKIY